MSAKPSVEEILAYLEAQMAHHKQREEHHAKRAVFHREQKVIHSTEYETIVRYYEAFKATPGPAVEIAVRTGMAAKSSVLDLPPVRSVLRSQLVARLVAEFPEGEIFQASTLAAEVNRLPGGLAQARRLAPRFCCTAAQGCQGDHPLGRERLGAPGGAVQR